MAVRKTWKLGKETTEYIGWVMGLVRGDMEELREAFGKQPEWWRESDEGNTVLAWLDEWDAIVEQYDAVDNELSGITGERPR